MARFTVDEINEIARECKFEEPTSEQIEYIVKHFKDKANEDTSGYWKLWIEQLLYDAGVPKIKD